MVNLNQQNVHEFIEQILADLKENNYLYASQIPNIDLYMDQVTTFMDEHLNLFKRRDEDKTLTKTMINNYSKVQLLPPTNKKKYSRNHMLLLLMIYYLKPVLSIPDIQAMLEPMQKILLTNKSVNISLEEYYNTLIKTQLDNFSDFSRELMETVNASEELFPESEDEDMQKLSVISTIYMLSLQASIQKHIVTQLIDEYLQSNSEISSKEEEKKDKKK